MTLLAYKVPSRDGCRVSELARRALALLGVSGAFRILSFAKFYLLAR
ncbi:hypothetical protein [uncultured Campylobacter sp.]|nr:hypothetical protein [uncultured Campylobacter sp.]